MYSRCIKCIVDVSDVCELGFRLFCASETYLVQAEETQVTDDRESADAWPCGDFSCHLQTDLHDLQRVCEDHLRSPGLKINNTSIPHRASKTIMFLSEKCKCMCRSSEVTVVDTF